MSIEVEFVACINVEISSWLEILDGISLDAVFLDAETEKSGEKKCCMCMSSPVPTVDMGC